MDFQYPFFTHLISLLPGFSNFVRMPALIYYAIVLVCLKPSIWSASFG